MPPGCLHGLAASSDHRSDTAPKPSFQHLAAPVVPTHGGDDIRRRLEAGEIDAVTFTSSSTVENFLAMVGADALQLLRGVTVCSIGPLTTATAKKHGLVVAVEPAASTLEAMVEAIVDYFK